MHDGMPACGCTERKRERYELVIIERYRIPFRREREANVECMVHIDLIGRVMRWHVFKYDFIERKQGQTIYQLSVITTLNQS